MRTHGFAVRRDEAKAESNLQKHRVTFEDAITVFGDVHTITRFDGEHSAGEDRFIDIGRAANGRILVVVYTERGERIRILSCRKATAGERGEHERPRR